jgi:RNA polymerase sigma-70 factor (ECF subfamily)
VAGGTFLGVERLEVCRASRPNFTMIWTGMRLHAVPAVSNEQASSRERLSRSGASWYGRAVPREQATRSTRFTEGVLAEVDALYNFAYRLTRSQAEAEDLVQDTFARAIAAESQFQADSNLRSWLFRILRNAHVDALRRVRRSPFASADTELEASSEFAEREPLRGDAEIEQLRGLVAEEIEAALATLSEEARTVILLDLEGFSEAEIALVMATAPGTVKSRLSRARALLRAKLAEYAK